MNDTDFINSYSPNWCQDGHVFVWSGSSAEGEVPEGYLCSCGKTRAHYEICSCCGQRHLVAKPIEYEIR